MSCAIEILSFQNFYEVLKTCSAGRKDFFDTLKEAGAVSLRFFFCNGKIHVSDGESGVTTMVGVSGSGSGVGAGSGCWGVSAGVSDGAGVSAGRSAGALPGAAAGA